MLKNSVLSGFSGRIFVFSFLVLFSGSVFAGGIYDGGDGTAENPFQIRTAEQLDEINTNKVDWDKCFVLTDDIYLGGNYYTSAVIAPHEDRLPGPFKGKAFSGVFDGDGHVISNLFINADNEQNNNYLGLFGKIDGSTAVVKNLSLENFYISKGYYSTHCGGICGYNQSGTISNCSVSGSIYCHSNLGGICGVNNEGVIDNCIGFVVFEDAVVLAGGICGTNLKGTISNCDAYGYVYGGDYSANLGGVCGSNLGGTIIDSNAFGRVSGGELAGNLGGICGSNGDGGNPAGDITNCSSSCTVVAGEYSDHIGGLCGSNGNSEYPGGSITGCYTTGDVFAEANSSIFGGLCGGNYNGSIIDSYSESWVSGGELSTDLGGLCGNNDEGTIKNCYATGDVEGDSNLGGFCGYNQNGSIDNCYSTGTVAGPSSPGGFCGYDLGGTITDSFWDVEVSQVGNVGDSNFGAVGKSTAAMEVIGTFVGAGWDFVGELVNGDADVWRLCVDGSGYPRLAWEYAQYGDFVCGDGVDLEDFAYFSARDYCDGCGGVLGSAGGTVDIAVLARVADMWLSVRCGDCGGGDVSGDNKVDMADFGKVASGWMCEAPVNWDRADLDGDGFVGDDDFDIWSSYWLSEGGSY